MPPLRFARSGELAGPNLMDPAAIPWVGLLWLGVATASTVHPRPQRDTPHPLFISLLVACLGIAASVIQFGVVTAVISGLAATIIAVGTLTIAGSTLSRRSWNLTWLPLATLPYPYWLDLSIGWIVAAAVSVALLAYRGRIATIHASAAAGMETIGINAANGAIQRPRPLDRGALPASGLRWPLAPTLLVVVTCGVMVRAFT